MSEFTPLQRRAREAAFQIALMRVREAAHNLVQYGTSIAPTPELGPDIPVDQAPNSILFPDVPNPAPGLLQRKLRNDSL